MTDKTREQLAAENQALHRRVAELGQMPRNDDVLQSLAECKLLEEQLKHEQQLLRHLIGLQEQERQMAAQMVHDGLLQDICGAHLLLQSVRVGLDPARIEAKVLQASSLLQQAIENGRSLIRDLRPLVLDEKGIVEAIRHLIAEQRKRRDLFVAFDHHVRFVRLESKREAVIFRIVQEALSNVMRHGETNHAAVQMTQVDGTLHVVVRDQGVGFDPRQVPPQRLGLRGICERARLFGGQAAIESAPGQGTTVRVQLPLQSEVPC